MNCIIDNLIALNCGVLQDVPARKLSTYGGQGKIDIVATPKSIKDLKNIAYLASDLGVNYSILGAGSNTLISDSGYKGIVIRVGACIKEAASNSVQQYPSYYRISSLANECKKLGLSGLEPLSCIPASLGGAIVMNAGCYGTNMADIINSVTVFNMQTGASYILQNTDIPWGYRSTGNVFNGCIITSATLNLVDSSPYDVSENMSYYKAIRQASQPTIPSLGSTFKRVNNISAAYYIDKCGLKGCSVGGAMVSVKHAGFIVNYNNGSAADYLALADICKKEVQKQFGIELEKEIIYLS
ncbi:MAG: UDP-N-acetylmuramate dehydrogenase [Bacillota bacterium]